MLVEKIPINRYEFMVDRIPVTVKCDTMHEAIDKILKNTSGFDYPEFYLMKSTEGHDCPLEIKPHGMFTLKASPIMLTALPIDDIKDEGAIYCFHRKKGFFSKNDREDKNYFIECEDDHYKSYTSSIQFSKQQIDFLMENNKIERIC
jgi:hypothetical protein